MSRGLRHLYSIYLGPGTFWGPSIRQYRGDISNQSASSVDLESAAGNTAHWRQWVLLQFWHPTRKSCKLVLIKLSMSFRPVARFGVGSEVAFESFLTAPDSAKSRGLGCRVQGFHPFTQNGGSAGTST